MCIEPIMSDLKFRNYEATRESDKTMSGERSLFDLEVFQLVDFMFILLKELVNGERSENYTILIKINIKKKRRRV